MRYKNYQVLFIEASGNGKQTALKCPLGYRLNQVVAVGGKLAFIFEEQ